jgi:predicted PurR-regulated permease PerM
MNISPSEPQAPPPPTQYAIVILCGAVILALLYLGREILVPITLAVILSLLLAPLVKAFRHWRLGHVSAVLSSVALVCVLLSGLALVIIGQVVAFGHQMPDYERTIKAKFQTFQSVTVGRLETMRGEAQKVIGQITDAASGDAALGSAGTGIRHRAGPVPVEVHEPAPSAFEVMSQLISTIWGPLGTAGIVLVTLIFALLEHESMRDRFIRIAGGNDIRGMSAALNDAGERLSRYFISQLAVNAAVGAIVWVGLLLIGVPQALLWAVITGLLRFVPYVGIFVAAGTAALVAAAVDPGWSLCVMTLGLYAIVEVIVSQAVEPLLYGHSTGLSPMSVVLAAIFWSWIWGPTGLLLSTPLTLCLVVAGRNIQGLAFLDVLLGDAPALTLSQRFYQRALAGDALELIADADAYLARKSFARYCDEVIVPAFRLADADFAAHTISPQQQHKVRNAVVTLIESIGRKTSRPRRRPAGAVLQQQNLGIELRRRREATFGGWQGPREAPPGSVVICMGLGTQLSDLMTELLVRVLIEAGIDAHHYTLDECLNPPPDAKADSVAITFIVSMYPDEDLERGIALANPVRHRLTEAPLVAAVLSGVLFGAHAAAVSGEVDAVADSFESALAHARLRLPEKARAA